jgi:hypothetical protein
VFDELMNATRSKFNDVYDTAADYYRPLGQAAMSGANKFGEILNHPLNSWSGMGMLPKAGLALSALLAAGYRASGQGSHRLAKSAAEMTPDELRNFMGMGESEGLSLEKLSLGQHVEGPPPTSFARQQNIGINFFDLKHQLQSQLGPWWDTVEPDWQRALSRAQKQERDRLWPEWKKYQR